MDESTRRGHCFVNEEEKRRTVLILQQMLGVQHRIFHFAVYSLLRYGNPRIPCDKAYHVPRKISWMRLLSKNSTFRLTQSSLIDDDEQ